MEPQNTTDTKTDTADMLIAEPGPEAKPEELEAARVLTATVAILDPMALRDRIMPALTAAAHAATAQAKRSADLVARIAGATHATDDDVMRVSRLLGVDPPADVAARQAARDERGTLDPDNKLAGRWYTARQRQVAARLVDIARALDEIHGEGMDATWPHEPGGDPEIGSWAEREADPAKARAADAWSWLWEEAAKARAVVLRVAAGPVLMEAEIEAAIADLRQHAPETYRAIGALALRLVEGNADLLFQAVPGDRLMAPDPLPPPMPPLPAITVEVDERGQSSGPVS